MRQGEEFAGVGARGHEVVARAFGGGFGEHRGFDVHEAVFVQVAAQAGRDFAAQDEVFLHDVAAQVDGAVFEADFFGDVVFVQLEGQRLGFGEDGELFAEDFDFAAGKVGVFGARGAQADAAFDGKAVFVAYLFGEREGVCGVGVNDDLDEAAAVA